MVKRQRLRINSKISKLRVSVIAAFLIAFGMVGGLIANTVAKAAELDIINNVTITNVTTSQPGITHVGDAVTLQVNWSTPSAAAGDTFTLNFPTSPIFNGTPANFPLNDATSNTIANCSVTATQVICTFTPYAATLTNLSGNYYFNGSFMDTTSSGSVNFMTGGGTAVPVTIPGGGVVPQPGFAVPTNPFKDGKFVDTNADGEYDQMEWSIYALGSSLVGPGNTATTLTDTFDSRLAMTGYFNVYSVTQSQWMTGTPGAYQTLVPPANYTMTPGPNSNQFQITFNPATVNPDLVYFIRYRLFMPVSWAAGDSFSNSVSGDYIPTYSKSLVVANSGGNADGFPYRDISLTKVVKLDGDEVTSGDLYTDSYDFQISCVDSSSAELSGYPIDFSLSGGQSTTFSRVPVNSTCEITETNSHGATTSFDFTNPISVTSADPAVIELTATNNFDSDTNGGGNNGNGGTDNGGGNNVVPGPPNTGLRLFSPIFKIRSVAF